MERIYDIACYFCQFRGIFARIVITKTRTQKHIPEAFFLLTSQQARFQNKSYRITEGYIMRIIQNIKIKSNYSGVLYREVLPSLPSEIYKGLPSLLWCSLVLCYFHIHLLFFCHILRNRSDALATQFSPVNQFGLLNFMPSIFLCKKSVSNNIVMKSGLVLNVVFKLW